MIYPGKNINFNWICPNSLNCNNYNKNISEFIFNITDINFNRFKYGLINVMKMDCIVENKSPIRLVSFFILHNDTSINTKMKFNITNYSNNIPTINQSLTMSYQFIYLNYSFAKYFDILWSVDKANQVTYSNGQSNSLFVFSYNNFGNLTIFCKITHKNSMVYNIVSQVIDFPFPPENGTCILSPSSGVMNQTDFTFQASGWKLKDPLNQNLKYKYGYIDYEGNMQYFSNSDDMTPSFPTKLGFTSVVTCHIFSDNITYSEVRINVNLCNHSIIIMNKITVFTLYGYDYTLNISLSNCTNNYPYTIEWNSEIPRWTTLNNNYTFLVDHLSLLSGPKIYDITVLLKVSGNIVGSDNVQIQFVGVI